MRIALILTIACMLAPSSARSQKLELKLDHLKAKAADATEVDLDGAALDAVLKSGLQNLVKPPKEMKGEDLKQLLSGVKGVYVRVFEFAKPGEYTEADVESVLSQVRGNPLWSKLISVKEKNERTEVHIASQADQLAGLLVVVAEPKELTVVNIVGTMPLDKMKELVSSSLHYDLKNLPGATSRP
jgi:hypothetical protein